MHIPNIMDRVMASLHDGLRSRGYAGLLQLAEIQLQGTIDEAALRKALERLTRLYPVAAARWRGRRWEAATSTGDLLTVIDLPTADPSGSLAYAEQLFARPLDLAEAGPVQFHLLRAPDGRDRVLLLWAHSLMDGKAGELLLQEVNRLSEGAGEAHAVQSSGDALVHHIHSHSFPQRLRALVHLARDLPVLGRPIQLIDPRQPVGATPTVRILRRCLDERQTSQCLKRVQRLLGFANPAPVMLAAAFRAAARVAGGSIGRGSVCYTHMPVNLRPPGPVQPIFHNLQSYVRIKARPAQLADRNELARILHRQFRDQLRRGFDLGFLRGVTLIYHFPRLTRWLLGALCRRLVFVFGYHGTVAGLETFCGAPVDHLWMGVPNAWSPPGIAFGAHQYRGRINLMVSFVAEVVSDAKANAFVDGIVGELLETPNPPL